MFLEEWRVPTKGYHTRSALWMKFKCDGCSVIFEHQGGKQIREQRRHFCELRCKYACMARDVEYKEKLRKASKLAWQKPEMRKQQSLRMRQYFVEHPEKIPAFSGQDHWAYGKILPWWKPWMSENPSMGTWIRLIKRMFGHECAMCGNKKNLHAHHIVPQIVNPTLMYDLNNGVTLCQRCHNGSENESNAHKLLRENPEQYKELMMNLLLKRSLC